MFATPYHHVLLQFNHKETNTDLTVYEFDNILRMTVLNDLIYPYLMGDEFQFQGYFINPKNVIRIVVKTSIQPIASLEDSLNASQPEAIFYTTKSSIFNSDRHTKDVTKEIFDDARSSLEATDTKVTSPLSKEVDRSKVFIVHGHDEAVKISVARFVEKFNLTPIILHEQASSGMTIIEKIEAYSNVGFGIILYTPCDVGKAKNSVDLQARARQNVVFEHGYLTAKIGRNNVCALVKDNIEKPNDFSGVVYVNYDPYDGWKTHLAKELKSSGYEIDLNLLY